MPEKRRKGNGHCIEILGATQNNLKNINVKIPLGVMTCVTGISGSGKSSLINEILYKRLAGDLNGARIKPAVFGVLGLFVLASLLTMAAGCLQVQLACALGMQWPQSRLGASIGMYVLLSVATQILWTAATVGGGVFLVASGPHITTLPATEVPRVLMTAMGGFCLLCFILCAVYFAVTRWLLTKRLNLA